MASPTLSALPRGILRTCFGDFFRSANNALRFSAVRLVLLLMSSSVWGSAGPSPRVNPCLAAVIDRSDGGDRAAFPHDRFERCRWCGSRGLRSRESGPPARSDFPFGDFGSAGIVRIALLPSRLRPCARHLADPATRRSVRLRLQRARRSLLGSGPRVSARYCSAAGRASMMDCPGASMPNPCMGSDQPPVCGWLSRRYLAR